jgi:hypothetical protein
VIEYDLLVAHCCSFLASRDRVKGACCASVAAGCDDL